MNKLFLTFLLFISFSQAALNYKLINYSKDKSLLNKYCLREDKQNETLIAYLQNPLNDFSKLKEVIKKLPPHSNILIFIGDKLIVKSCKPGFFKNEQIYIKNNSTIFDKLGSDLINESKDDLNYLLGYIKKELKKNHFTSSYPDFSILDNYPQADVFIFYNKPFNIEDDLNYAYVYESKFNRKNRKNFYKYKAFLKGSYTQFPKIKNVSFFQIPINMKINNRKYKGNILLKIKDNENILNGWIEIYGVLLAPLKGKVKIKNNKLYKMNASVAEDFYYYGNWAKKGDKIKLYLKYGKYEGKYFNYGYVLKNDPTKYFEYSLIGK